MKPMLLDGKKVSQKEKEHLTNQIQKLKQKPKLVVVKIGDNKASEVYIKMKERASNEVGINFEKIIFKEGIKEKEVIKKINELNKDKKVHAILVQLPIPKHLDSNAIINAIDDKKDVDGLKKTSNQIPCTALGVMKILEAYDISIESKRAIIIGRSNLVGKPLINLFLDKNATVISANSYTKNLKKLTKSSDIIVSAVGKKDLIESNMIKGKPIIIDVGINKINNKLYGDVNEKAYKKAKAYTPVPGGVGPMTVTMLYQIP